MGNQDRSDGPDAVSIARSVDEPAVFAELFERHFSVVYRFLSIRAGEQSASDLAAETFVIAFRRRADYDVTRPDARPWLLGIAANLVRELVLPLAGGPVTMTSGVDESPICVDRMPDLGEVRRWQASPGGQVGGESADGRSRYGLLRCARLFPGSAMKSAGV